jgi:hypothetical protein
MNKLLWLSRSKKGYSFFDSDSESDAKDNADDLPLNFPNGKLTLDIYPWAFEKIYGISLSPGEYCPVRLHIENVKESLK